MLRFSFCVFEFSSSTQRDRKLKPNCILQDGSDIIHSFYRLSVFSRASRILRSATQVGLVRMPCVCLYVCMYVCVWKFCLRASYLRRVTVGMYAERKRQV